MTNQSPKVSTGLKTASSPKQDNGNGKGKDNDKGKNKGDSRGLFSGVGILTGLSIAWIVLLVLSAVLVSVLPGVDPSTNDYSALSKPPSLSYPLGTDNLGRNVLVRTLYGARSSILIACIAVIVGGAVGTFLGVGAGYLRGKFDSLLGFLVDVMLSIPALLIVITIVALRGPSLMTIALIIAIMSIPAFARIARASALTVSGESYVLAAKTLGASRMSIMFREVMPNVLPAVVPYALTSAANAIILEGALSFLGYGLRPPTPSWGGLISDGRSQLADAPWVTMGPALMLCLTIIAINLLSEHIIRRITK